MDYNPLYALLETAQTRQEFLETTYSSKIEAWLSSKPRPRNLPANIKNIDSVLKKVYETDPTSTKTYSQWILIRLLSNNIMWEDLYKLTDNLAAFDKKKHLVSQDKRDLNKIKDYREFLNLTDPLLAVKTGKEEDKEDKEKAYSESTLVYDGPEGRIIIPKTKEASCFLGKGTKWCTAATKDNLFRYYNKLDSLYVIILKNGTKFQFHLEAGQLMDEKDERIDFGEFDQKNPWVFRVLGVTEEDFHLKVIKDDSFAIQHIKNPSEKVQLAAVKQDNLSIKHIKNPTAETRLTALKLNGFSIQYIKNPTEEEQLIAVKTDGGAIRYIENPSKEVQRVANKAKSELNIDISVSRTLLNERDKQKLKVIRHKIKLANKTYFNSDSPEMSDEEYDNLVEKLRKLNPSDRLLKTIGAPISNRKSKVSLPVSMPSLPKIHVGESSFTKWLTGVTGDLIVTDKLDGVSALYFSDSYGEAKLYTRGDGSTGGDITQLIPVLRGLPVLKPNEMYRGEIVLSKSVFAKKYASEYGNARNLVSGIVNANEIHPAAKSAAFILHESIRPKKSLITAAPALVNRGFMVVFYKKISNLEENLLVQHLQSRKDQSKIDIDGVVLEHNGNRVALKGLSEIVEATVKEVEWNVSRRGLLKPVIILSKKVLLAGAYVSRVTGHNARTVYENGIGAGAVISCTRSGEVIPKFLGTIKKAKPDLPPKNTWKWQGVDIVSTDVEDDSNIIAKQLTHFLVTIGVDKIKTAQLSLLVEAGIDTIKQLVMSNTDDFTDAGMGPANSQHLFNKLRERLKEVDYATMGDASGLFPASIGSRILKTIIDSIGVKDLLDIKVTPAALRRRLKTVENIGPIRVEQFLEGLPEFRKFLKSIKWKQSPKQRIINKPSVTGKTFAFTGFRDKLLESLILKHGGFLGGVSSSTDYLVAKDPSSSSSKINKAAKLGIKIWSTSKLQDLFR
jgi:DNA ligase (NAD+)